MADVLLFRILALIAYRSSESSKMSFSLSSTYLLNNVLFFSTKWPILGDVSGILKARFLRRSTSWGDWTLDEYSMYYIYNDLSNCSVTHLSLYFIHYQLQICLQRVCFHVLNQRDLFYGIALGHSCVRLMSKSFKWNSGSSRDYQQEEQAPNYVVASSRRELGSKYYYHQVAMLLPDSVITICPSTVTEVPNFVQKVVIHILALQDIWTK